MRRCQLMFPGPRACTTKWQVRCVLPRLACHHHGTKPRVRPDGTVIGAEVSPSTDGAPRPGHRLQRPVSQRSGRPSQHIALAPHARPLTRSRGHLIVGSSLRFDGGRRAHRMSPARQRRACARRCSDGARREEGDKCRGSSRCKTFFTPNRGGEWLLLCPLLLLQQCPYSELRM